MQIMHTSAQAVASSATAMGKVSAAMDPAKLAAQVRQPSRAGSLPLFHLPVLILIYAAQYMLTYMKLR
jgi:hypothetical protein